MSVLRPPSEAQKVPDSSACPIATMFHLLKAHKGSVYAHTALLWGILNDNRKRVSQSWISKEVGEVAGCNTCSLKNMCIENAQDKNYMVF